LRSVRPRRTLSSSGPHHAEGCEMLDLIFIAVTVGFFVLVGTYARGCEQL
jgi:hypothetical protein